MRRCCRAAKCHPTRTPSRGTQAAAGEAGHPGAAAAVARRPALVRLEAPAAAALPGVTAHAAPLSHAQIYQSQSQRQSESYSQIKNKSNTPAPAPARTRYWRGTGMQACIHHIVCHQHISLSPHTYIWSAHTTHLPASGLRGVATWRPGPRSQRCCRRPRGHASDVRRVTRSCCCDRRRAQQGQQLRRRADARGQHDSRNHIGLAILRVQRGAVCDNATVVAAPAAWHCVRRRCAPCSH
jgi:hypothetical protein